MTAAAEFRSAVFDYTSGTRRRKVAQVDEVSQKSRRSLGGQCAVTGPWFKRDLLRLRIDTEGVGQQNLVQVR